MNAIDELRQSYPLPTLLKVSGARRSTFYYHLARRSRVDKYSTAKQEIKVIFDRHKGRYGYRRIRAELNKTQWQLSGKTVLRLMRCMGLKCNKRGKKYRSFKPGVALAAPNVLAQNFAACKPNQKWVTDVTEFKVSGKKLCLSPVIDLFNREVVAYTQSERPWFGMVQSMVEKAFTLRDGFTNLVLHSDRGWQYLMPNYKKLLKQHNVTISMSRKGNCYDNAAAESFFATLKNEMFHGESFDSIEQLKSAIDDYIHYYNHERIRLPLGGLSPVEYREHHYPVI